MELHQKSSAINEENWHVSTWAHRAWFTAGCAIVLFSLAKSLIITLGAPSAMSPRPWLEAMLAALAGYVAADLTGGIYHWAIDNYGSPETPFFGSHIEGFQYHHQHPTVITQRQLANNLHYVAQAVAFISAPITILCNYPIFLVFTGVLGSGVIFTQQTHVWAHTPNREKLPPLVVALQDAGIILTRSEHAKHHRPPFNSNYCILVGWCNSFLDKIEFFRAVEVVVERVLGHRPRSWSKLE